MSDGPSLPKAFTLIGMPGSGKSTVGRLLAIELALPFIDTDTLIEETTGSGLPELLATRGRDGFLDIEQEVVLGIDPATAVIATGGSVIYRGAAMKHLLSLGPVVFLNAGEVELANRAGDPLTRGVVIEAGTNFAQLFQERLPLYYRYCHFEVDASGSPEEVVRRVEKAISNRLRGK